MKLSIDPRLPLVKFEKGYLDSLNTRLYEVFRGIATAFNGSAMWDGESSSVPATGTWAQGDMVRNTAPIESGAISSKYVNIGWICVSSGTPGTWVQMRVLTGN